MAKITDQFEIPVGIKGSYKAKCKHCPVYISGHTNTTGNLSSHIKVRSLLHQRKHKLNYLNYTKIRISNFLELSEGRG